MQFGVSTKMYLQYPSIPSEPDIPSVYAKIFWNLYSVIKYITCQGNCSARLNLNNEKYITMKLYFTVVWKLYKDHRQKFSL